MSAASTRALSAEGLRARARVLRAVRGWLHEHGYLEVPTPALVPSPAMEEHLFAVPAGDHFLRTSPEFALKRVLAAGLPRIYEIGPCFRDREHGAWHGREFTMLEWYRAGAGPDEVMDEVEALVAAAAAALDVSPPSTWRRTTVRQLFEQATGIDLATAIASDLSEHDEPWDDAFLRRWVADVEPGFSGGLFVTAWPASQAALSQVRSDGPWPAAQRFETYLDGVELANGFLELIDPTEQRRRFAASNAARAAAGEAPHPLDEAFVRAVGRMPRTTGIALGIDRLVAVLAGWEGIAPGRVEHPAD